MTVPVPVELFCVVCYGLPPAEQSDDVNAVTIYRGESLCDVHAAAQRLVQPDGTLVECTVCLAIPDPADRPVTTTAYVVRRGEGLCSHHALEIMDVLEVGGVFGQA